MEERRRLNWIERILYGLGFLLFVGLWGAVAYWAFEGGEGFFGVLLVLMILWVGKRMWGILTGGLERDIRDTR